MIMTTSPVGGSHGGNLAWTGKNVWSSCVDFPLNRPLRAVLLSLRILRKHCGAAREVFEIDSPFAKNFLKRIDAGIDILSHYAIMKEPSPGNGKPRRESRVDRGGTHGFQGRPPIKPLVITGGFAFVGSCGFAGGSAKIRLTRHTCARNFSRCRARGRAGGGDRRVFGVSRHEWRGSRGPLPSLSRRKADRQYSVPQKLCRQAR